MQRQWNVMLKIELEEIEMKIWNFGQGTRFLLCFE